MPGAAGDHLLGWQYDGYITEEDTFVEDGALVLRNQKRSYEGESPEGQFDYTSGWVMSMHRVHFNKGYVEVRAQFPSGDKGRDKALLYLTSITKWRLRTVQIDIEQDRRTSGNPAPGVASFVARLGGSGVVPRMGHVGVLRLPLGHRSSLR